jgi:hypothetical protein
MGGQATEYLTEESLGCFLHERVDPDIIAGKIVPGVERPFRPDYRSERHRLIVEYDGDMHYRSAKKILADKERDRVFGAARYRVVRIPYFVQLTREVVADLFGTAAIDHSDFLRFPHGFVAETVVMPVGAGGGKIGLATEPRRRPLAAFLRRHCHCLSGIENRRGRAALGADLPLPAHESR